MIIKHNSYIHQAISSLDTWLLNAVVYKGSWDYYEQLYGNKMDNQEEMDKFLKRNNLSRLNQEEIENINWQITSTKI